MRRKKNEKDDKQLLRQLDPNWASRMPDNALSIQKFPRPARFVRIDVRDDGVETALTAEFRLGEEPQTLGMFGNKELVAQDFLGRFVRPLRYHIETFRKRQSTSTKPKLLSWVPGIPGSFSINPGHIFQACDAVIALDTNSSQHLLGDDKVSVLGVAITEKFALKFPKLVKFKGQYAAEFRNLIEPKEKIGWAIGLRELFASDVLDARWRIVVIVDAFANELAAINSGVEILPGYRLPEKVHLAYASADTAQLHAVNKSIRVADRISSDVMKQLFKTQGLTKPNNPIAGICTGVRYWRIEEVNGKLRMGTQM